jgi:D-inositol-3-phosphate glycosyltransferase
VVVVPSYNESFGLVAIEAQACGTPVVAAAVGGLGTAVKHGESGLLVAGHDPVDYAEACARLLENPAARARMGEHARRHAAHFGWGETARRTLEVYEEAQELSAAHAGAIRAA